MKGCAFLVAGLAILAVATGCRRGNDAVRKIAQEGYQLRSGGEFEMLAPQGKYLDLADCGAASDIYVPDGVKPRFAARKQGMFSMSLESEESCNSLADKYVEKMKKLGWTEQGRSVLEGTAALAFAKGGRTVQVSIASDGARRLIMLREQSPAGAKP